MKYFYLIVFLLFLHFYSFSDENTSDLTFKKAFNFTIGCSISSNFSYEQDYPLINKVDSYFGNNYSYNDYIESNSLLLGLPASFLFFLDPRIAVGFSLNIIFFNFNTFFYLNPNYPVIRNNVFTYNGYVHLLFKLKSGKEYKKHKFVGEIGPVLSFKILHSDFQYESDDHVNLNDYFYYNLLVGPYLSLGSEYNNKNFSLEYGGFVDSLFGFSFSKLNYDANKMAINELERDNNIIKIEAGIFLKFNYYYLKIIK